MFPWGGWERPAPRPGLTGHPAKLLSRTGIGERAGKGKTKPNRSKKAQKRTKIIIINNNNKIYELAPLPLPPAKHPPAPTLPTERA